MLAKKIPVFPLSGALLLPSGNLPLNIFEPRYIDMVNYAMKNDRVIGMIQPSKIRSEKVFKTGCLGKITSYAETDDNRYLINLKGLSKFDIIKEIKHDKEFKIFNVSYDNYKSDFTSFDNKSFNKKLFIDKIKKYFTNKNIDVDISSLENIDNKLLIVTTAMICPFNPQEKQVLLECNNLNILVDTVFSLFEFSINENMNNNSIN